MCLIISESNYSFALLVFCSVEKGVLWYWNYRQIHGYSDSHRILSRTNSWKGIFRFGNLGNIYLHHSLEEFSFPRVFNLEIYQQIHFVEQFRRFVKYFFWNSRNWIPQYIWMVLTHRRRWVLSWWWWRVIMNPLMSQLSSFHTRANLLGNLPTFISIWMETFRTDTAFIICFWRIFKTKVNASADRGYLGVAKKDYNTIRRV